MYLEICVSFRLYRFLLITLGSLNFILRVRSFKYEDFIRFLFFKDYFGYRVGSKLGLVRLSVELVVR